MLILSFDEPKRAPSTYETVKVLDVQRLRRSLRRRAGRGAEIAARLAREPSPHIVAVDWRSGDGPSIDYFLFDDAVLVNSRLSPAWEETKLAAPALDAIARALATLAREDAPVRDLGNI